MENAGVCFCCGLPFTEDIIHSALECHNRNGDPYAAIIIAGMKEDLNAKR